MFVIHGAELTEDLIVSFTQALNSEVVLQTRIEQTLRTAFLGFFLGSQVLFFCIVIFQPFCVSFLSLYKIPVVLGSGAVRAS